MVCPNAKDNPVDKQNSNVFFYIDKSN